MRNTADLISNTCIARLRALTRSLLVAAVWIGLLQTGSVSPLRAKQFEPIPSNRYYFPFVGHFLPVQIVASRARNAFGNDLHALQVKNVSSSPVSSIDVMFQVFATETPPGVGWITGTRSIPVSPPLFPNQQRLMQFDYNPARRIDFGKPVTVTLAASSYYSGSNYVPVEVQELSRETSTHPDGTTWYEIRVLLRMTSTAAVNQVTINAIDSHICNHWLDTELQLNPIQPKEFLWTVRNPVPIVKDYCTIQRIDGMFSEIYAYGVR